MKYLRLFSKAAVLVDTPVYANDSGSPHAHGQVALSDFKLNLVRASLVLQRWSVHQPTQETRARALVQEDPTCRRATKPAHDWTSAPGPAPHDWTCAPGPAPHNWTVLRGPRPTTGPVLRGPRPTTGPVLRGPRAAHDWTCDLGPTPHDWTVFRGPRPTTGPVLRGPLESGHWRAPLESGRRSREDPTQPQRKGRAKSPRTEEPGGLAIGSQVGHDPAQHRTGFPVAQVVKNSPAGREPWVRPLGQEEPLETGKAAHSSVPAWRSHGQRSLAGCSPRVAESGTTERLSTADNNNALNVSWSPLFYFLLSW